MKQVFPLTAAAVFACALSLGAQSTTPQTPPPDTGQKTSKAQKMSSGRAVTLTGCLREGESANSFELTDVDMTAAMSGMKDKEHQPTTGTTGSATSAGMDTKQTVALVASSSVNLKEHLGHRVEVTGTMAGAGKDTMKDKTSATGTTGSATGETTSDTTSRTGAADRSAMGGKGKHTLNVRSLKHLSETCSM